MRTDKLSLLILMSLMLTYTSISMAVTPGVDEHVKLYLKFDEGKGDEVEDLSGNNNNGTITGAKWVEGKFGKALEFNGAANADAKVNYVEILGSESLDITDNITIEAWVNPTDIDCGYVLLKQGSYGAPKFVANTYQFYLNVAGQTIVNEIAGKITPDTWQHCAAVYDGEEMRQYLNGELVFNKAQAGAIDITANKVTIGNSFGWHASGGKNFMGRIDEVRVSDIARTVNEIRESMKGYIAAVDPDEKLAVRWGSIKKN